MNAPTTSKVPHVTALFWVIKIFATTLGETGGDAVSMTLALGYGMASLVFLGFFVVAASVQIFGRRYHPFVYWATVVATTTVGTTMSDFLDRTLGLGYVKSSALLLLGVLVVLVVWRQVEGKLQFEDITSRRAEAFYWLTILVSNTLGTALGDCVADSAAFGFAGGALLFAGLLALVAAGHRFWRQVPTAVWFWAAYVLTRPLGATLGDVLTKPVAEGGLALGRIGSSLAIAAAMVVGIIWMARRERQPLS